MDETTAPEAAILVEELSYRYPEQQELALDRISFSVRPGEFIGVIGPNRAGKSTLCQALVGLVPHFYKGAIGGRVMTAGIDVHHSSVAEVSRRVGLVFQNPFTQISGAKLTVREEVAFGLEQAGVPREEMVRRVDRVLALLGLQQVREQSPFALSGGQMQRLAIASVLAMQPSILILDEPTSQLDPQGTREVFAAVSSLCDRGITVVMAEHKLELLAERADRLLALQEGRVLAYGAPGTVLSQEEVLACGVGEPAVTEAARLLQWRLADDTYPVTSAQMFDLARAKLAGEQ